MYPASLLKSVGESHDSSNFECIVGPSRDTQEVNNKSESFAVFLSPIF